LDASPKRFLLRWTKISTIDSGYALANISWNVGAFANRVASFGSSSIRTSSNRHQKSPVTLEIDAQNPVERELNGLIFSSRPLGGNPRKASLCSVEVSKRATHIFYTLINEFEIENWSRPHSTVVAAAAPPPRPLALAWTTRSKLQKNQAHKLRERQVRRSPGMMRLTSFLFSLSVS
jgi:hypothetical protein